MTKKINKKACYLLSAIVVICLSCIFIQIHAAGAYQDTILKGKVAKFKGSSTEKIKHEVNMDMDMDKEKLYVLSDDEYYYRVGSNGEIHDIITKDTFSYKTNYNIGKDEIINKAYGIVKKLDKTGYVLSTIDNSNSSQGSVTYYTLLFKQKNSSGINTGSFISMILSEDGRLSDLCMGSGDPNVADKSITISQSRAIEIVMGYLKSNDELSKYANTLIANENLLSLGPNQYTIERDVFKGRSVWSFYMITKENPSFRYVYLVDANTGELFYKDEPL